MIITSKLVMQSGFGKLLLFVEKKIFLEGVLVDAVVKLQSDDTLFEKTHLIESERLCLKSDTLVICVMKKEWIGFTGVFCGSVQWSVRVEFEFVGVGKCKCTFESVVAFQQRVIGKTS